MLKEINNKGDNNMAFDFSKLATKVNRLRQQKREIESEYNRKIKDIDKEIEEEQKALDKVNEVLKPYICSCCDGSGEETFSDAAGSRDYRKCTSCGGIGVNM